MFRPKFQQRGTTTKLCERPPQKRTVKAPALSAACHKQDHTHCFKLACNCGCHAKAA